MSAVTPTSNVSPFLRQTCITVAVLFEGSKTGINRSNPLSHPCFILITGSLFQFKRRIPQLHSPHICGRTFDGMGIALTGDPVTSFQTLL